MVRSRLERGSATRHGVDGQGAGRRNVAGVAMSDGRISPDDLASQYIPGWSADPLKSKITIRHLATHTSGIADAEQDGIPHDQLPGWKGDFWKRTPDPFSIAVRQAPVLVRAGHAERVQQPGHGGARPTRSPRALKGGDIRTLLKERVLDPLGIPERRLVDRVWPGVRGGRAEAVRQLGRRKFHRAGGGAGGSVDDAARDSGTAAS